MSKLTSGNMTIGSPARHILLFSLPLLAGNLLQQLYNMVDSIVVGRFVGATALAAVGTAFPVVFLLVSLFMGLGIGAMVMVSQFFGANDGEKLKATIDTIYTAMLAGAIPLAVLGILLIDPLSKLLAVPADTLPAFRTYMFIMMLGLPGNLGYNANAGILQGVGDSRTSLLFLAVSCVINIVLDLVFVLVFGWGVAGVAIATAIAQTFSWLFGIFYINAKHPQLHIEPLCLRFDKQLFGNVMRLGIPASIQQALFSFGVMAMLRLINGYGSAFSAGYNAANKVDMLVFMPIQSFSTAATTFVGQNIGAGRHDRVHQGARAALGMSVGFSVLVGAALYPLSALCMRLFTTDPAVVASGVAFLHRILPFYSVLSIMFIINAVMRGAGEMMVPVISSILSLWLARVPAAYLLAHFFGAENLHFCFVIGWEVGIAICVPYYLTGRWERKGLAGTPQTQAEN